MEMQEQLGLTGQEFTNDESVPHIGDWSVTIRNPPPVRALSAPEPHRSIDLFTLVLAAIGGALVVFMVLNAWA